MHKGKSVTADQLEGPTVNKDGGRCESSTCALTGRGRTRGELGGMFRPQGWPSRIRILKETRRNLEKQNVEQIYEYNIETGNKYKKTSRKSGRRGASLEQLTLQKYSDISGMFVVWIPYIGGVT